MISIRELRKEDVGILINLINDIAIYHNQEEFVLTNESELLKSAFGDNPRFGVLLAEHDSEVAGYVSYTWNYSIWLGADFMNIDDLFIWEKFRGKGIGEALMFKAKETCKEKKIGRITWEVEENNHRAIQFYKRLGAELQLKGKFRWDI